MSITQATRVPKLNLVHNTVYVPFHSGVLQYTTHFRFRFHGQSLTNITQ